MFKNYLKDFTLIRDETSAMLMIIRQFPWAVQLIHFWPRPLTDAFDDSTHTHNVGVSLRKCSCQEEARCVGDSNATTVVPCFFKRQPLLTAHRDSNEKPSNCLVAARCRPHGFHCPHYAARSTSVRLFSPPRVAPHRAGCAPAAPNSAHRRVYLHHAANAKSVRLFYARKKPRWRETDTPHRFRLGEWCTFDVTYPAGS